MGETFLSFAEQIVAERKEYIRGPAKEANRFRLHVATAAFAPMVIETVRPKDIAAWHREMWAKPAKDRREARTISRPTIERCHALVSVVFAEAVQRDLVPSNPCAGVKLKRRADESATREKWKFLTIDEQRAIFACEAIPEADRLLIKFALGTGMRQGEILNLELPDLHVGGADPHVMVRYGSPNHMPPKSGKVRKIPLFGIAAEAAERWLALLPTYAPENPHDLVFPSALGTRKACGKPFGRSRRVDGRWVDPLRIYLAAAGVKRVRFHDMRHSAATSLLVGAHGRKWRPEEIKSLLGHSSLGMTEKYAHFTSDHLAAAARETEAVVATEPKADVTAAMARGPEQVRQHVWRSGLGVRFVRGVASKIRAVVHFIEETGT